MIRTQCYVEKSGTPFLCGPDELMFLGEWVTADIQLSPLSVLEAFDLVAEAKGDPEFAPEDLDGNAHTVTISPQGVRVENFSSNMFRVNTRSTTLFPCWSTSGITAAWRFPKRSTPADGNTPRRTGATRWPGSATSSGRGRVAGPPTPVAIWYA
ncbi:hypothetical protein [Streptomyces sp. NPDC058279]|uniref:hypothetical protein n=1 Tax=Streptomyces sp. NPDC058279 TaxID=3346418 RepID=UPI0036EB5AC0